MLFVPSNLGHMFVQHANVFLTGNNYTLFSMTSTHVFYADVFQPLHILFKYFANIFVTDRTAVEDIYIMKLVFIVYL